MLDAPVSDLATSAAAVVHFGGLHDGHRVEGDEMQWKGVRESSPGPEQLASDLIKTEEEKGRFLHWILPRPCAVLLQAQDDMAERRCIQQDRRLPRVIRRIATLQEEEINRAKRGLDLVDDLDTALVDIHILILGPPPDVFAQRLEAEDRARIAGRMVRAALASANEDLSI